MSKTTVQKVAPHVERLRNTEGGRAFDRRKTASYMSGMECGVLWARDTASVKELRRLKKILDDYDTARPGFNRDHLFVSGDDSVNVRADVFFAIRPSDKDDYEAVATFWADLTDEPDAADDDYVLGFAEGAEEFWRQVANLV